MDASARPNMTQCVNAVLQYMVGFIAQMDNIMGSAFHVEKQAACWPFHAVSEG